jgi:hypothetical protein
MKYEAQLAELADAVDLHQDGSFSWFGHRSGKLDARTRRKMGVELMDRRLSYLLTSRLYESFYLPGGASRWRPTTSADAFGDPKFLKALQLANCSRGPWQSGWLVRATEPEIIVERDGLQFRVRRDQVQPQGGESLQAGEHVSLHLPREHRGLSPGFYMAVGDVSVERDDGPFVRFYWHLAATAAPLLLRLVTSRLAESHVLYRLKVANHPRAYDRTDAGVIYVAQAQYEAATHLLAKIYGELRPFMRPTVPALTKQVRPGLGIAHDPDDGDSYGMNRCRIIAEAIIEASRAERRRGDLLAVIRKAFTTHGLDPNRPFLRSSAEPDLTFPAG